MGRPPPLLAVAAAAAALLVASGTTSPRPPAADVRAVGRRLVDGFGRSRLYSGVNVVFKPAPYHPRLDAFDPSMSLVAEDVATLRALGVNVVRLLVAWPGAEPERGAYNSSYLSVLEDVVKDLGDAGIVTILDAHQDLFGPAFCGNGVPPWATHAEGARPFPEPVTKKPYPLDPETGLPERTSCQSRLFAEHYLSDAVGKAFQRLYDNADGTRDSFVAFWRLVAERFAGNPNVLGYELLNEPWPGDVYEQPSLLEAAKADAEVLLPLWDQVSGAIRTADPDALVLFEPTVVASSLPLKRYGERVGYPRPPLGSEGRAVLSYHTYCPLDVEGGRAVCSRFFDQVFGKHLPDALDTAGVPGFLTEWGSFPSADPFWTWTADEVMSRADELFLSRTYWQFKDFGDPTTQSAKGGVPREGLYNLTSGTLDEGKARLIARPYASAVAGVVLGQQYAPGGAFVLRYLHLAGVGAPTEIRWSRLAFPGGVSVSVAVRGTVQVDRSVEGVVLVDAARSMANGTAVAVTVTDAAAAR